MTQAAAGALRKRASPMLALAELERNPVAIEVVDDAGHHMVSAERGKYGKVRLTCQCPMSWSDGWCRHRLNLLCFRYDCVVDGSARTRRAFEQIVAGTSLHSAGDEADRALRAFDECLAVFDAHRPVRIVGRDLGRFAEFASDLAACSGELVESLDRFRHLLERD